MEPRPGTSPDGEHERPTSASGFHANDLEPIPEARRESAMLIDAGLVDHDPFDAPGVQALSDRRSVSRRQRDEAAARIVRDAELLGAGFRRADLDGRAGEGCVVDWLAEPGDLGVASALLTWLEDRASRTGAERVVIVVPEYAPEFVGLQRVGFRVEKSRMFQAVRCFVRSITARWLYEHWHLTLGDTELV